MEINKTATATTPEVQFNTVSGKIQFSGVSSPENSVAFYHPFLVALGNLSHTLDRLDVGFNITHFNSASSRCIYDLLKIIRDFKAHGTPVNVTWAYEAEDEDMLHTGEDFSQFLGLQFNFAEQVR